MNELMNRLNLMDCMEGMGHFPDKYFDLAIVDPPYGINESAYRDKFETKLTAAKKYNMAVFNQKKPDDVYFSELTRVSKNQIIWGGNYFGLPGSRCYLVWKKNTTGGFADAELAWTSFDTSVRLFDFTWNGMIQGYGGNKSNNEIRIHPTQKPVALYRWILDNYAKPGDKILDTHVGSGSSLIACWEEGFEYCGFEIDEDYYLAACNRIEQVQAQGKLFATV